MKFYREVTDEMKYLTALYIDSDVNCREVAYYTIGSFFNKIIILDDIENALNVYMNNNIDLIFLDTDIDTINILKEIRKINKNVFILKKNKLRLSEIFFNPRIIGHIEKVIWFNLLMKSITLKIKPSFLNNSYDIFICIKYRIT